MIKKWICFFSLVLAFLSLIACEDKAKAPADDLKVVIIRHGEKPADGDNLSCQGQNRAFQLANVLHQKYNLPNTIYVPALSLDKSTSHSRMFQTITPFAVKYNLPINSKYQDDDYEGVAKSVLKKNGTVLMVWSHQSIPKLAEALGLKHTKKWQDADFDSIWEITYNNGEANLDIKTEGLQPAEACAYWALRVLRFGWNNSSQRAALI